MSCSRLHNSSEKSPANESGIRLLPQKGKECGWEASPPLATTCAIDGWSSIRESKLVRHIYKRYLELGSVRLLKHELDQGEIVSKTRVSRNGSRSGGRPFSRGALYELLANPIYIGEIRHKGLRYAGQHEAIVDQDTWEKVQRRLCDQTVREGGPKIKSAASILAGKLFDENGEPLYATAAKGRHGGRYRYYVSRDLIRRGPSSVAKEKAWRLAAPQLERSVLVSVQRILNDGAAIAARLQEAEIPLADIQLALKAAEARAATLESLSQETPTIAPLVERVDLRKDGVTISINLQSLLPTGSVVRQRPSLTFTEFVPLRMKRRGVAMRLVIGGSVSTGTADPTLLKAVARGRKWFNELASGHAKFTQEIAAREGVNGRFVRRLIPLAFLSPAIVQAIAEGRHPANLTGEALSRGIHIPVEWAKQPAGLGFD